MPSPYVWEIQATYERWWLNKYLEDGRKIIVVTYIGNRVYGCVTLTLDDYSTMFAPMLSGNYTKYGKSRSQDYRPRKKNLVVFDEKPEVKEKDEDDE